VALALALALALVLALVTAGCGGAAASPDTVAEVTTPDTTSTDTITTDTITTDTTSPDTIRTDATGTDAADGSPQDAPVLPVTVTDSTGAEVTIESVDRIVPVDGDLAEVVFALGLGDRVVATDLSATYPPEVDRVPDIGYQRALNAEPIAAVEPTIVLATDLAGPPETLDQVRALGIDVVVIEREFTLDGPARKVMAVADALGVPQRGRALVAQMQGEIDAAVAAAADVQDRPRVLVLYLRGELTQLIFGAGTGVDVTVEAAGGVDVAAELGVEDTRPLSAEAIVAAAPDVFVVTTRGLASVGGVEGFLALPGIAETPAGRAGRVLAYEDQYLLGLGPRYGQLLVEMTADLHGARPATAPSTTTP
jgi:iron complex transport system substrate-binding protein